MTALSAPPAATPPAATPSPTSAADRTIRLPRFRRVIWLLPAAYALHIVEEFVGGFPGWVTDDMKGRFDGPAFVVNNIVFMAVLLTLVTVNTRRPGRLPATALVVFGSANLFWDALFHLFTTPLVDRYSPGLVTAMLLYIPISLVVALVVLKERVLPPRRFVTAVCAGLVLFSFICWYGLYHFAV